MATGVAIGTTGVAEPCVVELSATNTHPASGSVATVRATRPAKSASVRVASTVGAITRPVATSKFAVGHCVPWRMDSCSRRSTRPGLMGNVSAARSTACMPVFSSTQVV